MKSRVLRSCASTGAEPEVSKAGPSTQQVRTVLYLLAGLLGIGGLVLLSHESKYPYLWGYSRLYLRGLGAYFVFLLAVVAVARLGARPLAHLLGMRLVRSEVLRAVGCATILLLLEGVLAVLPARFWNPNPALIEGEIFARQEPPLHHIRPANSHQVIVSPYGEFRVEVRINSDNLRDVERPIAKPLGTTRILVLGDSMVEALQVPLEQTFCKRLERLLTEITGRPVDVINGGVAGYSPTLEYLMLRHKGLKYAPDVVIMAFFMDDVADDWAYRKDLVFDGRGVPLARAPRDETLGRNLGEALLDHSRILQLFLGNLILLRVGPFADVFKGEQTPRELEAWEITKTAVRATRDLAVAHGAQFSLVVIPNSIQVSPREELAVARVRKSLELVGTSTRTRQILAQFAQEQHMPYLDLLPVLQGSGVRPLFSKHALHLTPQGHEVTAQAIATFLLERGLVPKGGSGRTATRVGGS